MFGLRKLALCCSTVLVASSLMVLAPALTTTAAASEILLDGGFEAGTGDPPDSPNWTEADSEFGNPLCVVPGDCPTGGGTPPRSGSKWAFFGGSLNAGHTASISQLVIIPVGTATLTYWYRNGWVTTPFDAQLLVKVDGTTVNTHIEAATAEGAYSQKSVSLNAYANGAAHTVSFEYTNGGDGLNNMTVDDVSIDSVTAPNDPPTAVDDTRTVAEDSGATTIDVRANDTDPDGGPKTITSVSQPPNGSVVITSAGANLTYTPDANYCNGGSVTDNFTYTLNGGSVGDVAVTVSCVDDLPTAVDDTRTVAEDSGATTIDVRANDTDPDGGPKTITSVSQPPNGSVAITSAGANLTYTPDANYCNGGSVTDNFTYTLNGGSVGDVAVTVSCVDDLPTAVDDTRTVAEDSGATTIDVRANDTDPDGGPKTITSVSQPPNGSVAITSAGANLTYTPDANYCNGGSVTDNFTYTLNGGSVGDVAVTVSCVDDLPTAVDDTRTVAEDSGATTIDVRANDTDPDGGPKTITSVSQPPNGSVVITSAGANLTYTPDANYCNGGSVTDNFTYTLNGGSVGDVAVTVSCVDDLPTAVDDTRTVAEDSGATTIDVRANDTDPDGGPKTITSVSQPPNGSVVITSAGANLTYTPDANYCNGGSVTDNFTYTLNGGSVGDVAVTVSCVDDLPTAVDDTRTVAEDSGATTIDVRANDTDPDGGPKTITSVSQPPNGSVVITSAGANLTYTPDANYCNGGSVTDNFTYTLNGGSVGDVAVTVSCVDDLPTAVDDTRTVAEDSGATTIDVRANDTDPDGGPKTITSVSQPPNGSVAITSAGANLTYTPDANYCNGGSVTDNFTYTLNGGSVGDVAVTVTCEVPDATRPDTTFTIQPAGGVAKSLQVLFAFTSNEAGSTFSCALDTTIFTPCTSPKTLRVSPGPHVFKVAAIDTSANTDATPATSTFIAYDCKTLDDEVAKAKERVQKLKEKISNATAQGRINKLKKKLKKAKKELTKAKEAAEPCH